MIDDELKRQFAHLSLAKEKLEFRFVVHSCLITQFYCLKRKMGVKISPFLTFCVKLVD